MSKASITVLIYHLELLELIIDHYFTSFKMCPSSAMLSRTKVTSKSVIIHELNFTAILKTEMAII